MTKRSRLLIGAIFIAVLGVVLVGLYANQARTAGIQAQEAVEVLVATDQINIGTNGATVSESGAVALKTFPSAAVPEGAMSSLAPLDDSVTTTPIYPGQILVAPMFTDDGGSSQLGIPEGKVAISFEFEVPERVASFVQPGSDIALYGIVDRREDSKRYVTTLADRAKVIAVANGTLTSDNGVKETSNNSDEVETSVVTLALTETQARNALENGYKGKLQMALLNKDSKVTADAVTVKPV